MEWPMVAVMEVTHPSKRQFPSICIPKIVLRACKCVEITSIFIIYKEKLIFRVSTKRYNQIDLTPTLALLLSVEIPTLSIGCLIPEMLESLSLEHQMYAYFYNAHHLLNKARVKFGHEHVHRSGNLCKHSNVLTSH